MRDIKSINDFVIVNKPIENIVVVPSAIKENFAEFILEECYKPLVKKEFNNHPSLLGVRMSPMDKHLTGFNMYGAIVLETILEDFGYRSMNFGDIQGLIEDRTFSFNGSYYDLGVRFAGAGKVKATTSKNLEKQLTALGFDVEKISSNSSYLRNDAFDTIKNPIWIPKSELVLDFDSKYKSGIGAKLKENAKPVYMKNLAYKNNLRGISGFSKEDGILFNETSNPIQFCASENGTSRIILKGISQVVASTGNFSIGHDNSKIIMFEK